MNQIKLACISIRCLHEDDGVSRAKQDKAVFPDRGRSFHDRLLKFLSSYERSPCTSWKDNLSNIFLLNNLIYSPLHKIFKSAFIFSANDNNPALQSALRVSVNKSSACDDVRFQD